MVAAASQLTIFAPNCSASERDRLSLSDGGLNRQLLLDRVIDLLVQKAIAGVHWPEVYAQAERLLQAVALAAGERQMVFQRMLNAKSYAVAGEYGAAVFELRMLRTQLA